MGSPHLNLSFSMLSSSGSSLHQRFSLSIPTSHQAYTEKDEMEKLNSAFIKFKVDSHASSMLSIPSIFFFYIYNLEHFFSYKSILFCPISHTCISTIPYDYTHHIEHKTIKIAQHLIISFYKAKFYLGTIEGPNLQKASNNKPIITYIKLQPLLW